MFLSSLGERPGEGVDERKWPHCADGQGRAFALKLCTMADFPKKTLADWEKLAAKELRDKPVSSLDWVTPEGIVVKPLYTAADLENLETTGTLPGFPPFTRGPKATM